MSTHSTDRVSAAITRNPQLSGAYPTLQAARFRLRPFAMHDIEPLTSLAREHRIADTTIGIPHPYTADFARMWITSHEKDWSTRQALHWAASRHGEPHHLAGYAGLVGIDLERRHAELRFWVGRGVERHSDALEWSEAVIDFAFNALGIDRVYGLQMHRHKLAGHVLESLGMSRVGSLRKRVFSGGLMEDVECWAILRPAWHSTPSDQKPASAVDALPDSTATTCQSPPQNHHRDSARPRDASIPSP
jgi:[ribosomal protein S5]-alanine N-acetyltransferase